MNKFSWISDFVKYGKAVKGLSDLLPNRFANYYLIPWSVGIIDSFPFDEYPDSNDDIENLNKQHAIEQQFGVFLNENADGIYRKATLKEMAERFKVAHCADTASLVKDTPGIASLYHPTVQALRTMISSFQEGQSMNLYIEDDYRFQPIDSEWKYNKETVKIDASAYIAYQASTSWDSTSYLFPDSLDWCLCTLENYPHFIFCCNDCNDKRVQAFEDIEVFKIDYKAEFIS